MAVEAPGAVEMRGALLRLRRATGLPVAFGGLLEPGRPRVRISELTGTATPALRALAVSAGSGLGGKAVALGRPCAVTDYPSSRQISHEYDAPVAAEGLRSVLAVPVVVRRRVRGVLYGALRSAQPLGDRTLRAAVEAARDVEQALLVREEARELLTAAREPEPAAVDAGAGAVRERMREAHAALRALAPRLADPMLRAELLRACELLAAEPEPGAVGAAPREVGLAPREVSLAPREVGLAPREVGLTPREVDVLAWVAVGATNAVAAERLGLRPETVKGYLRSAMRKLGARTRGEAVSVARRAGVLP